MQGQEVDANVRVVLRFEMDWWWRRSVKGLRVAETRCASEQVPYATTTLARHMAEANMGLNEIKLTGDGVGRV
jgi:hypothetical protein